MPQTQKDIEPQAPAGLNSNRPLEPSTMPWLLGVVALMIASIVTAYYVDGMHAARLWRFVAAEQGIVTGHPHWRAYQNRILIPYAVLAASHATSTSFGRTYLDATHLLTIGMTFAAAWVFRRITGIPRLTLIYTLMLLAVFCMLQDVNWLYAWDYVDVAVFALFTYGIVARRSMRFFVPLFCVALLNHEIALLIPAYLALSSLGVDARARKVEIRSLRQLTVGVFLMAGGLAWTELIRHLLFKSSLYTAVGSDSSHALMGNHVMLLANLASLTSMQGGILELRPLLVIASLIGVTWTAGRASSAAERQALLMAWILAVATFVSGKITETRVWFPLAASLLVICAARRAERLTRSTDSVGGP